ncbi:tRNA (adenosine(37)-N6)-threonylcarbamoyltransferase complex ATPase subunit type 1 TsaE [Bacteroidota bacterium]
MELPYEMISKSETDTKLVAKEFSKIISKGDVIALKGELGAGKTYFVKSVCEEYDINNSRSPSFSIVNEYDGKYKCYHFDFYRIKQKEELYNVGYYEYIKDLNAITFIEWSDFFPSVLPEKRINIELKFKNYISRKIIINKNE